MQEKNCIFRMVNAFFLDFGMLCAKGLRVGATVNFGIQHPRHIGSFDPSFLWMGIGIAGGIGGVRAIVTRILCVP